MDAYSELRGLQGHEDTWYFESVGAKEIKSYSLALCTDSAMILQQTVAEAEVVQTVEAQLPWVKSRYVVRPDD